MTKSRVDLLFKNFQNNFPHHLGRDFPRILRKLMLLWATPEFDDYMQQLLVNSRAGRQGFSTQVVSELMFINKLHESCREQNITLPPIENPFDKLPRANRNPNSYMLALQRGDISQIHIYLDGGVPVDYSFEDGDSTPLIIAASNDQPVVVSLLIQLGANVNARDKGEYAPLHWAAFYGHATVASLLLKNGADIDAQQNTGATPLYLAVIRNKTSMVELLLRHGADTKLRSVDGSPLDVALKKEQNDIIKLLLG